MHALGSPAVVHSSSFTFYLPWPLPTHRSFVDKSICHVIRFYFFLFLHFSLFLPQGILYYYFKQIPTLIYRLPKAFHLQSFRHPRYSILDFQTLRSESDNPCIYTRILITRIIYCSPWFSYFSFFFFISS